jgi:hypothetical protein
LRSAAIQNVQTPAFLQQNYCQGCNGEPDLIENTFMTGNALVLHFTSRGFVTFWRPDTPTCDINTPFPRRDHIHCILVRIYVHG